MKVLEKVVDPMACQDVCLGSIDREGDDKIYIIIVYIAIYMVLI